MRIVCLLGSPRPHSNSKAIAERFCKTAAEAGAVVETFALNKLQYRGCQACLACKKKLDRCALQDDLSPVLDAAAAADVLVLATPVYFGEISTQLKGFIDRTFSYLKPDYDTNPVMSRLAPGKKLVFIQSQADPDAQRHADIFPNYDYFFKWYGFSESHLILAEGLYEEGDALKREDILERADRIAKAVTGPA
ncbi:MAG: flavodoxin family protein [Desulfobacteraceae bacterium]|nr:flavodoxin family protein [Desulfobacteraceae bacterium]